MISYYNEPKPLKMTRLESENFWPLISYGIVNPYGPTLMGFIILENEQKSSLELVYYSLNPFSQTVFALHELTEVTKKANLADLVLGAINRFSLANTGTPTLLIPSEILARKDHYDVFCNVLIRTSDVPKYLKLLNEYPKNPWDRISKEIGSLFKQVTKAGARQPEVPPGPVKQADPGQIEEYISILSDEAHRKEEVKAFVTAWNGAIDFQKSSGNGTLAKKAMSFDRFYRFFGHLVK